MHKTQIRCRWQRGLSDAWADARGRLSQDGHELHTWGDTAEADDPPVVSHVISIQSCPVMATSRMPEIPTIIRSPLPKMKKGSALCLAQGTAIPNKLGPVGEGREGRHPAKT